MATPVIGTVTTPGGEEERVYIGASNGLSCLALDRIRADRESLENDPGTGYVCGGASYPVSLEAGAGTGLHGSAVFSRDQRVMVNGQEEIRDVLFQPSAGIESHGAEMYALDAYTSEKLWIWAPPNPLVPATMWSATSISRDRTIVYITTSNLGLSVPPPVSPVGYTTGNLLGGRAESVVALDAATGEEVWLRQHRLFDADQDIDIGNGATVADVEGENGCHVVVVPDKDGCVYAYDQEPNTTQVGDPDYDRLRPGQQRLRWRTCVNADGFGCMTAAFDGRWVFAGAGGWDWEGNRAFVVPGVDFTGDEGSPDDDVRGFAFDPCTGEVKWTSSSIPGGQFDGALASGMFFQRNNSRLQIVSATDGTDLATIALTRSVGGGGGPAILGDGRVLVPGNRGLAVFAVVPGSNASAPQSFGSNHFEGPYASPAVGTGSERRVEDVLRTVLDTAGVDSPVNP